MNLTEFYEMLFMSVAVIWIYLFLSDVYMRIKAEYYKKTMYNNLSHMFMLYESEDNQKKADKIRKVISKECEKMYYQYIRNNKYLQSVFLSPEDLLTKFIITINNKDRNYIASEILCDECNHKAEICKKESAHTTSVWEKVSSTVTIIGTIVTIISTIVSFFIH